MIQEIRFDRVGYDDPEDFVLEHLGLELVEVVF